MISKYYKAIGNSSNDTEVKESRYIDWLEKSITNKNIDYYKYSKFKHLQPIGSGSHGSVVRANRKNEIVALKYFNNDKTTLQQVINELELHRNIDVHDNILRLYGVTKIKTDIVFQMNKYCLVLEYADGGTLSTYLKEHFKGLKWENKLNLALQLARAVSHLHKKNIIHRDLHDSNILVHRNNIKIADFGLSKQITEKSNSESKIFGVIPYVDPKCFNNPSQNYKLSKASDIYSVGVLLWEISSGRRPFYDTDYDIKLSLEIINGKREKIIDGTPVEYSNLYRDCWRDEPNERPDIKKVVDQLTKIMQSTQKGTERNKNYENDGKQEFMDVYIEVSDKTLDLYNDDLELSDEEGISSEVMLRTFKNKEHQEAWERFDYQAKDNNIIAY